MSKMAGLFLYNPESTTQMEREQNTVNMFSK